MKTLEFDSHVTADKTLTVPSEVAVELEPEQSLRVILIVPGAEEDRDWGQLTAEQFLKGYAESDSLYDDL